MKLNIPLKRGGLPREVANAIYWLASDQASYSTGSFIQINADLIEGMGTCTIPTDYQFIDEYPVVEGSTYWYWLESISLDGDSEIFDPISLLIQIQGEVPIVSSITSLKSAYPNPFNPTTSISFEIMDNEIGVFSICNIKGEIIKSKEFNAGSYIYQWYGNKYSSGIYFYKLETPTYVKVNKMLMLK